MLSAFKNVLKTFDARNMSAAVRQMLEQEERNGQIIANRIRYIFAIMFFLSALALKDTGNTHVNFGLLGLYLILAIVHSVFLARSGSAIALRRVQNASLIGDYAVFVFLLLFYTLSASPDNFAFATKNPIFYFLFLPLALSTLQFRLRPVVLGLIVILLVYTTLVIIILRTGVPQTDDWLQYVLGPAVIVSDLFSTRYTIILGLGLIFVYSIYRALRMVQRIAAIEAQKSSLARYFSPEVVEEISSTPDVLRKGGRQPVTVLFSDIRGFTSMSERMDVDTLAEFLGEFRERMSAAIFANGGTLDKFIGDAIMATFGTPRPGPEPGHDARSALQAARGMLVALDAFNVARAERGQAAVRIGIGLHFGEVFAGNIGSGDRLEFTVIGDAVNTASRIESLCKKLNAALLISEEVYELTGRPPDAERMPRVMVRGKEEALQVYRIRKLDA